jgi:hypothetical protein
MNRNSNSENETRVKTFQIQNSADEEALNTFLAGKAVRHWSVNFAPATGIANGVHPSSDGAPLMLGVWNVFVAYNDRETEGRGHDHEGRHERFASPAQKKYPGQNSVSRSMGHAGDRAPAAVAEKSAEARKPVESYKPEVSDQDFPLFESIRTWRNARAREERVKPFSFFNNRQLEQVVTVKPADAPALKEIATDMEPRLWEKYHKELLGFIDAARSTTSVGSPIELAPMEAA